ncbi:MAG: hypothetical protein Fur0025_09080 [Oscillatoriaceae cyanobacterium]
MVAGSCRTPIESRSVRSNGEFSLLTVLMLIKIGNFIMHKPRLYLLLPAFQEYAGDEGLGNACTVRNEDGL